MENLKFAGVNIDANALEEQDEILKQPKNGYNTQRKLSFDPKNYLDLKLKEGETSKTVKVRFLPISATDKTVFFNIGTHALKVDKEIARSGFKSYVCLNDEKVGSTEECPICRKSKELFDKSAQARSEGNEALSKSLFKEACSLRKKRTFIVRVIDRDHEDEGVKFWRFNENSKGEGIYDKLMSLYTTRRNESIEDGDVKYYEITMEDGVKKYKMVTKEVYDTLPEESRKIVGYNIFDLYEGKDIIINVTKSQIPDGFGGMKDLIAYNITDGGSKKPLSKDVEKANSWLNDPKSWKDVYSNKSADYLDLVVNGKIPVYSKEHGGYVEKVEYNNENRKMEEAAATEILMEKKIEATKTAPADDELPF